MPNNIIQPHGAVLIFLMVLRIVLLSGGVQCHQPGAGHEYETVNYRAPGQLPDSGGNHLTFLHE